MELRHLRYFAALAGSLSFTRAAERVHVDNSLVWRVRLVTASGEIRLIVIDEATGRVR